MKDVVRLEANVRRRGVPWSALAAWMLLGASACTVPDTRSGATWSSESVSAATAGAGSVDGGAFEPNSPLPVYAAPDPCAADVPYIALPITTGWGKYTGPSLTSWQAAIVGDRLCVKVLGNGLKGHNYTLFLETDGDPNVGLQWTHIWPVSGADYIVSGNAVYKTPSQTWENLSRVENQPSEPPVTDAEIDISVVLGLPGVPGAVETLNPWSIKLGLQLLTSENTSVDYLPRGGDLAPIVANSAPPPVYVCPALSAENREYTPPSCENAGGGALLSLTANLTPPIDITRGMVIPAYVSLESTAQNRATWKVLERGAERARTLANPRYRDYFVAVNGKDSGPPDERDTEAWSSAKAFWDPIHEKGGHLFGYVHTGVSHLDPVTKAFVVEPQFRPLATVEKEIAIWVCKYPNLDGIWIDEFNPRFEVAKQNDTTPTFPNGELRPVDTRLSEHMTAASFAATAIDPKCGYYDRLTSWIHRNYPHLRIIGNAGGTLLSNQHRYASLVDILCGFESSLYLGEQSDWAKLNGGVEPLAHANLALIHAGDKPDVDTKKPQHTRAEAIDAALAPGLYTHVYATDNLHGGNLWGEVPLDALGNEPRPSDSGDAGVPMPPDSGLLSEVDYVFGQR